jgi:hypothetical protein
MIASQQLSGDREKPVRDGIFGTSRSAKASCSQHAKNRRTGIVRAWATAQFEYPALGSQQTISFRAPP